MNGVNICAMREWWLALLVLLLGVVLAGCPAEVESDEAVLNLQGAVTLEGEEDASGIGVRLSFDDGGIAGQPTVTDSAGAFLFPNVPGRNLRLEFYKEGYLTQNGVPAILGNGVFAINEGEPVVLKADRSAAVMGRLTSTLNSEELLWDNIASVTLRGEDVISVAVRPDGRFERSDLRPGLYTLQVEARGHISRAGFALELRSGQMLDMEVLELEPRVVSFEGVVVDNEQSPIGGVTVRARQGQGLADTTLSDAEGRFRLNLVSFDHLVSFDKEGFASADGVELSWLEDDEGFVFLQAEQNDIFLMEPLPKATLQGLVSSGLGELEDWPTRASVELTEVESGERRLAPVIDGAQGKGAFQFVALPLGAYSLRILAEGHANHTEELELVEGANALDEVILVPDLQAENTATLQGRVCRRSCALEGGHAGIRVRASIGANPAGEVTTREDGRFALFTSRTGHSLEITADGFLPQRVEVRWSEVQDMFLVDEQPLDEAVVVLAPDLSASVSGTLRSDDPEAPFEDVRVRLDCIAESCAGVSTGAFQATRGEGGGQFSATGLIPGRYQLSLELPGYAPVIDVVDLDGEVVLPESYFLVSDREGETAVILSGLVVLENLDDEDVGEVVVRVYRADRGTLYASTTANEEGDFSLLVSPDLDYTMVASLEGWQFEGPSEPFRWSVGAERFESAEGQAPILSLTRDAFMGSIAVTLQVFPEWLPQEQRTAGLRLVSSNTLAEGITDQIGGIRHGETFTFGPLPVGTYFVIAERSGFEQVQRVVEMRRGQPEPILSMDLHLQSLDSAGIDLSGERVTDTNLLALGEDALRGADLSGVNIQPGVPMEGGPCEESLDCENGSFCDDLGVCVTRASLCGSDLSGASFVGASLDGVDLSGARLTGTNFSNASLVEARLTGADMQGASFFGANMHRVNLSSRAGAVCPDGRVNPRAGLAASMLGADFSSASLVEARFSEARYSVDVVDKAREPALPVPDDFADEAQMGAIDVVNISECEGGTVEALALEADVTGKPDRIELYLTAPDGTSHRILRRRNHLDQEPQRLRVRYQTPFEELAPFVGAGAQGEWTLQVRYYRLSIAQEIDAPGLLNYWTLHVECRNQEVEETIPANAEEACSYAEGIERPALRLGGVAFAQTDLTGAYMDGIDFSGENGEVANLSSALLVGTRLNRACLKGGSFVLTNMLGAGFDGANLEDALFQGSVLSEVRFRGARMDGVNLAGANLDKTTFNDASMKRANLLGVTTYQTSFLGADLSDSLATGVTFSSVIFVNTTIERNGDFLGTGAFGDWRFVSCVNCIFGGEVSMRGLLLDSANMPFTNFASSSNPTVLDMSGTYMRGINLEGSSLRGVTMTGANLEGANLINADITDANLDGAEMEEATFRSARAVGISMVGARARYTVWDDADLGSATIHDSYLADASMVNLRMGFGTATDSNFSHVDFRGATLQSTDFSGSDFIVSMMPDVSLRFTQFVGAYMSTTDLSGADLTGSDFTEAELSGVNFDDADLSRTTFVRAKVYNGSMVRANLEDADFSWSLLYRQNPTRNYRGHLGDPVPMEPYDPIMDMTEANLTGTDFSDACVSFVIFDNATMSGVNFSRAYLGNSRFDSTDFGDADLSGASLASGLFRYRGNGIDVVAYYAPADLSSATFDTITTDAETRWFDEPFEGNLDQVEAAFRASPGQRCCSTVTTHPAINCVE